MPRRLSITVAAALLTALGSPVLADVRSGYDKWNQGDYFGAITEWRPLAIAGDADAQFDLGQAYKLGRGVPLDLKMAEIWFGKAAAQGHLPARDNYGLVKFQNGDRQEAMPYIEESASRGEPRAQYVMATALFNGDLAKKDWVRAYALMTRASQAGIQPASVSLAQMDKYLPVEQRQRGVALARTFDQAATKAKLVKADAPMVNGGQPASSPAAKVATKPVQLPPAPVKTAEIGTPPVVAKPPAAKPVSATVKIVKVEKPAHAAPAPSGSWKVQLGAFGDAGRIPGIWSSMQKKIAALGPYRSSTSKAGTVTRLQAGPLESRAAAEELCTSVRSAGEPCLTVAP